MNQDVFDLFLLLFYFLIYEVVRLTGLGFGNKNFISHPEKNLKKDS